MVLSDFSPLSVSNLKHNATRFDAIQPDMYLPALQAALALAREQIHAIRENPKAPDFDNTLLALENAGEDVEYVSTIFYNQLSAHTSDQLQALAAEIGPLLADFQNDILLDSTLFARIETVYESRHDLNLKGEELQLLDKVYSDFVRNGARLNEAEKEKLRAIDSELSKLGPAFSDNVLKATNEFSIVLTKDEEVEGLPEMAKAAARQLAQEKGHASGWMITLQAPSFMPFMQFGKHRPTREKLFKAYGARAVDGKYSNQKNLLRIVELREERAILLGFSNHAVFTLEKRMAETPEKVFHFLDQLRAASVPAAKRDFEMVAKFARESGGPSELMPWDFAYYSERLKEHQFQFSSEDLRPYFRLENVVSGLFEHARRLYGLKFTTTSNYPVYHPDVQVYEVTQEKSGDFVGLFYADFFPRDSKSGGAWMTNYFGQGLFKGEIKRPHVAIVCNFTKPTADKPSLLNYDEVNTAFHEFGHSLHSLLSKCRYRSLAGTNVYWDFVELPSQIMENWVEEKESLDIFARHYETNEPIPSELAEKLKKSARFMAGYSSVRQLTFAYLDMAWHTTPVRSIKSVSDFEEQITAPLRIMPKVDGTNFSCGFSHIFAGGYAAGYYSYKWAEVLDADAFELFKQHGLFDTNVAEKFRVNILERGGTEHPMALYKKFRGREPDPSALLRRDGLI